VRNARGVRAPWGAWWLWWDPVVGSRGGHGGCGGILWWDLMVGVWRCPVPGSHRWPVVGSRGGVPWWGPVVGSRGDPVVGLATCTTRGPTPLPKRWETREADRWRRPARRSITEMSCSRCPPTRRELRSQRGHHGDHKEIAREITGRSGDPWERDSSPIAREGGSWVRMSVGRLRPSPGAGRRARRRSARARAPPQPLGTRRGSRAAQPQSPRPKSPTCASRCPAWTCA
jgi:hypothetical protein